MFGLRSLVAEVRRDYQRHGAVVTNPAIWTLAAYRFGRWSNELDNRLLRRTTSKVYGLMWFAVRMTTGDWVGREVKLGEGFNLIHSGSVRIHPDSVIGDRVRVMHEVTLGTLAPKIGTPRIGNDVFIGTGAKVLGPVTVGDGAHIAANSLVVHDVPAGATAIGVPARIIPRAQLPIAFTQVSTPQVEEGRTSPAESGEMPVTQPSAVVGKLLKRVLEQG